MKKRAASVIVLAILLAGGWFGLQAFADRRLHAAITQYRAGLAPGDSLTFAHAEPLPLHLGASFTDLEIHRHGTIVRAHLVRLSHLGPNHVGSAQLQGVTFQTRALEGSSASADAEDLSVTPGANPPRLDQIEVGGMRWHDVELHAPMVPGASFLTADLRFSQHLDRNGKLLQHLALDQIGILNQAGPVLSIAHLTQDNDGLVNGDRLIDVTGTSTLAGLQIPTASPLGHQFAQIGYDTVQGDGASHIQYAGSALNSPGAPLSGTLVVDPTMVRLAGIGRISVTLNLDHLPDPLQLQPVSAGSSQARLVAMSITYDDSGLTGRLLKRFADRSGITPEQLRDRLRQVLQARGAADGNSGFEKETIRFLDDPRHLVIALDPPAPILLSDLPSMQLRGAAAAPLLGLAVKAD